MEFDRIVADADTLGGKPRIRGTRLSVEHILEVLADGSSIDEILEDWPVLQREDVVQAIRYASRFASTETIIGVSDPA